MPESAQPIELTADAVKTDLKALRLHGLRQAITLGQVPTLVALATKVAAEHNPALAQQITSGTAQERHQAAAEQIKTMIETAAKQLDGKDHKALTELFALELAPDAEMPTVKTRRSKAAGKAGYAPEYFKKKENPLFKALAELLWDRYGNTPGLPTPTIDPTPSTSPGSLDGTHGPTASSRPAPKKWVVVGVFLLAVVIVAIWRSLPTSHGASIPPLGSIVNTRTGRVSHHIPTGIAPREAIEGGDVFGACDLSAQSAGLPCNYEQKSISARPGDTIGFRLRLTNFSNRPIPYLRLVMMWFPNERQKNELEVRPNIDWPLSASSNETGTPQNEVDTVTIQSPIANVHLSYISKSTTLTSPFGHFLYHLPNGILYGSATQYPGIGLADVGAPISCVECMSAYTRFVSFQARLAS